MLRGQGPNNQAVTVQSQFFAAAAAAAAAAAPPGEFDDLGSQAQVERTEQVMPGLQMSQASRVHAQQVCDDMFDKLAANEQVSLAYELRAAVAADFRRRPKSSPRGNLKRESKKSRSYSRDAACRHEHTRTSSSGAQEGNTACSMSRGMKDFIRQEVQRSVQAVAITLAEDLQAKVTSTVSARLVDDMKVLVASSVATAVTAQARPMLLASCRAHFQSAHLTPLEPLDLNPTNARGSSSSDSRWAERNTHNNFAAQLSFPQVLQPHTAAATAEEDLRLSSIKNSKLEDVLDTCVSIADECSDLPVWWWKEVSDAESTGKHPGGIGTASNEDADREPLLELLAHRLAVIAKAVVLEAQTREASEASLRQEIERSLQRIHTFLGDIGVLLEARHEEDGVSNRWADLSWQPPISIS